MGTVLIILSIISLFYGFVSGNFIKFDDFLLSGVEESVNFILSVGGGICFFCGIAKISEESGLTEKLSRVLYKILRKPMPTAFSDKKTSEAVTLNLSSNILGLGSAATPFGIFSSKRIFEKDKKISRSLALFILMNTSSLQLIPSTVISIRKAAGCQNPTSVFLPVLITQIISTVFAFVISFLFFGKDKKS